jgi:hypothetical protein
VGSGFLCKNKDFFLKPQKWIREGILKYGEFFLGMTFFGFSIKLFSFLKDNWCVFLV